MSIAVFRCLDCEKEYAMAGEDAPPASQMLCPACQGAVRDEPEPEEEG